ncbi:MAG TPA: Gfo/Idh/MocA family oxidoreductase, partial [Tepidiformaceae bacterium]
EPSVEAVLIAVPDRFHLDIATRCLEAGRHVLVEKPMASSSAECAELELQVARTGLKCQVGAMRRHDPGIQFAREFIRAEVGEILSFSAWYGVSSLRPAMERTLFPPLVVDQQEREREAGFKQDRLRYLLMTHGTHLFDEIAYLIGDAAQLDARLSTRGDDYSWQGLWQLADGTCGRFELSVNVHRDWSEGFVVNGTAGSLRLSTDFPFFLRASDVSAFVERDGIWRRPMFGDTNPYERQIEAFARAIRDGSRTDPDAAAGSAAVRAVEAVGRSVNGNLQALR